MNLRRFVFATLLAASASPAAAAALGDTPGPSPCAASREDNLRQGELDQKKLNQLGIRTLRDMAQAAKPRVALAVGPTRADALVNAARHFTEPASIVEPDSVIGPDFIIDPDFLVDPDFKADDISKGKLASAAVQIRRLDAIGVRTYAELAAASLRGRAASVLGAAKADELAQRSQAGQSAGIINPDAMIAPAFLVDSRIIISDLHGPG